MLFMERSIDNSTDLPVICTNSHSFSFSALLLSISSADRSAVPLYLKTPPNSHRAAIKYCTIDIKDFSNPLRSSSDMLSEFTVLARFSRALYAPR